MKTVLVTGPMAGGKSTVCRFIGEQGWPVYDCDSRCKALYDRVPGLKHKIEETLGIPFSELGRIFSEPKLLEGLEKLVYPLLHDDILNWKESLDSPLAFIESAVATRKEIFSDCYDAVVLVLAPRSQRLFRNAEVARRDCLQRFEKADADYVLVNDGSIVSLQKKINDLLLQLK